jgi:carboxylesterase
VSCLSPTLFYDGWNIPWSRHLIPLCYHTPLKYFFFFKEDPPYGIKNERLRKIIHRYYNKARFEDMEGVAEYGYPYFPGMLICQLHLLVKHLTKRLPYIETPVQMIQAKEDDITSVKNSLFIRDNIGSKKKDLVLLYDSYHVITADQERDVVAEKMNGFFREIINAE